MTQRSQKSKIFQGTSFVGIFVNLTYQQNENIQQQPNAKKITRFENQLQFHVRKEPQNDTKITKDSEVYNF